MPIRTMASPGDDFVSPFDPNTFPLRIRARRTAPFGHSAWFDFQIVTTSAARKRGVQIPEAYQLRRGNCFSKVSEA